MLLLAYSSFTIGHVGSIQVPGLCGIKFHFMLQGLRTCLPILVECNVLKSWGGKWRVFIGRRFTCLHRCYYPRFRPKISNYNLVSSHCYSQTDHLTYKVPDIIYTWYVTMMGLWMLLKYFLRIYVIKICK